MDETRQYFLTASSFRSASAWQPAADVYRHAEGWLIKCDLAGVRHEDIELSVSDSHLTISGVRRDWTISEGRRAYSLEIAYNRFLRVIELPCDLMHASLKTDYRDGMLLIEIATQEWRKTPTRVHSFSGLHRTTSSIDSSK